MGSKELRSGRVNTSEYVSKIETILKDKSPYVKVESDSSQDFRSKVVAWADEYVKSNDMDDITNMFITDADLKPGNAYVMKCHKENRPLHIIAPGCNTAAENLSHWVKDRLKPLANTCKYRLQDTNGVIFLVE